MTAQPVVAVVAPLTGPRAAWAAVLLSQVEQVRAMGTGAVEWHVHDETPGATAAVAGGGYAAVIGHSDVSAARDALPAYRAAGLVCLLPFVQAGGCALSWMPDTDALARAIIEGASALGAGTLSVVHGDGDGWPELARHVGEETAAAGLESGGSAALAVLAPQDRFARLVAATDVRGPVLTVADCGLGSFAALAEAARDRTVWAVHPQMCAVRRARTAVTALAQALVDAPAVRGQALSAAVRARSGVLLAAGGGVVGDGWRISRLHAVCPARDPH
ncbi:hypothetical protein HRW23_17385 [Streptomyces lunaelactis]|uniref:hypothetical protein n=1 Tax=Streptomyces lunaelactis TaxID=1535768 RepID=UPI001585AAD2|nr:hypothetical protein [Streptomyces lunaelactis]NUK34726.1 hypothetical protein [Streptomyces lunaelactis]NUK44532.1 hypothetical protein [Streptomyces lunaelactis]NUK73138.1 hypothetical protein [Streptomyces lunaelactis]NUK79140.1 hypothetical protein [Streptomyces lunaelactis]NUK95189.1 hypothetical protein [Streptomyces lunaelactis]